MRQQQQPDNTHQIDFVPSAEAENMLPLTHPSRTTHVRKDTDRLEAKQTQLASDLAALSRLLNAPQPAEQLMRTALDVSVRLLSPDWKLRLFECKDSGFTLGEIVSLSNDRASDTREYRMTLGFGEAIDHEVMHEHKAVLTEQLVILPLNDTTETLVGVLVAMRASEVTCARKAADDVFLTVISAHLAALLARAAADRLNVSSMLAVQAAASLALPLIGRSAMQDGRATDHAIVPETLDFAQDRLLIDAVVALDEVLEAAGYARSALALAVTRTQSDEWRLWRAGASLEEAAPSFSGEMLCSITPLVVWSERNSVKPLEVGAESTPDVWAALAPLRAHIAEHAGIEVAHLTVLPITDSGQQVIAFLCLAWRIPVSAGMTRLLSLVTSIAVAASAGVRNLHLVEYAQAEGRARDAFISLSAHELRSPLTSIKGYAQLLLRQSKKTAIPESMLHSVESIEQQSVRMAEMVGELLDASRIRRGVLDVHASPVDVAPLARRVAERRAALFPQHTIICNVAAEPLVALADAQRVEQVLRDLIDNGARHMPKGGIVRVALSQQDGLALFRVEDQGIGIPEGERERIFEYLFRSSLSEKKNLSGLGLGLYISCHLVERFGGTLWLEASSTAEPTGSEFRFTLPLAVAPMDRTQDERHS